MPNRAMQAELTLHATLREIGRRAFEYLVIVATDPADLIYLAREARIYCPRVRLVTLGSHALYTHPDLRLEFSGMLVGTSYPLMLENQSWLLRQRPERERSTALKSFSSDSAQGVYNALQRLLHERDPSIPLDPLDMEAIPSSTRRIRGPLMWLSEVSSGRFWPLDVEGKRSLVGEDLTPRRNGRATLFMSAIFAAWLLVALAELAVMSSAIRGMPSAWAVRIPVVRLFASKSKTLSVVGLQYRACVYLTHALCGVLLAMVLLPTVDDAACLVWFGVAVAALLFTAGFSCWLRSSVAAVHGLLLGLHARREHWLIKCYAHGASLLVSCIVAVMAGICIDSLQDLHFQLQSSTARLLLTRLQDPLGMSAITPLVWIALGLYLWAAFALS